MRIYWSAKSVPELSSFSFLLLVAVFGILFIGCGVIERPFEPSAPKRNFSVEDLLLSQDGMPSGWQAFQPYFPSGDNLTTRNSVALHFGKMEGGQPIAYSTQYIFQYETVGSARRSFDNAFLPAGYLHPANEWHFNSALADESFFGCAEMAGRAGQACEYAGRYKEFIILFNAQMITDEMTFDALERVVRAIDAKMTFYLSYPVGTP
jgi:hypothetical protein